MSKTRRQIESLVDALDEAPIEAAEAAEAVSELGIDVTSFAARLRTTVAAADTAAREARYQEARRAYADEVDRLERRRVEEKTGREELRATFRHLLARAPRNAAVAAHFHKYESASDEELVELIRALQHLLEDDDK